MAALGGASLVIDQIQAFVENASAGRGFIALAVVVLAKWHPIGVFAAAGLVGITDALQLRLQAMGLGVPHELLLMLPYLLTILVLVGFVGNARYPAAAGLPYGKR
jgi:simple sugar transport system permease protein